MIAPPDKLADFRTGIPLADFTTIRLGGKAKYFSECRTLDEVRSALNYAASEGLPVQILGGGSNIIFPDEGFRGLVVKVGLRGVRFEDDGDTAIVSVAAGEVWDDLVKLCVEKDLAGIECLSGIPGSVGATPIQNVGAYGEEVKETIVAVKAIDRHSLELIEFGAGECDFGYRKSRFKTRDKNRYVIVEVVYRLKKSSEPTIVYQELRDYLSGMKLPEGGQTREAKLHAVREAVLALRRKKSMIVDKDDPDSCSVGSFFVNPLLSEAEFEEFLKRLRQNKIDRAPSFTSAEGTKVSAAWLVENSGFHKGYKRNGVGISSNHALALVNYSGTTTEVLSLASDIENAVLERFGIRLEKEAVVVS